MFATAFGSLLTFGFVAVHPPASVSGNENLKCTETAPKILNRATPDSLWALGATLLRDCFRRTPFPETTAAAIASQALGMGYRPDDFSTWMLEPAFRRLMRESTPQEKAELFESLRGRSDYYWEGLYRVAADFWLDERVNASLWSGHRLLSEPPPREKNHPAPANWTPEEPILTWRERYAGFLALYRQNSFPSREASPEFYQETPTEFWDAFLNILSEDTDEAAFAKLKSFRWKGWCGVGSSNFYSAKAAGAAGYFLAQGNFAAGIGALSDDISGGSRWMLFPDTGFSAAERLRRVLTGLGVNWEEHFLGMAADGNTRALEYLALNGREKWAVRLVEIAPAFKNQETAYWESIAKLVPAQEKNETVAPGGAGTRELLMGMWGSSDPIRERKILFSPSSRARVVRALEVQAKTIRDGILAEQFAILLTRSGNPELMRAAIALCQLPYVKPRKILEDYFGRFGFKPEWPPVSEFITLRLFLNGTPLKNDSLGWAVADECLRGPCSERTSTALSDSLGHMSLKREQLIPGGTLKLWSAVDESSPESPGFLGKISLPAVVPDSLEFQLDVGSIEIRFAGPLSTRKGERRIFLFPSHALYSQFGFGTGDLNRFLTRERSFPETNSIRIDGLPLLSFRICATAPGWSFTCQDSLIPNTKAPSSVTLIPEKGSDVRFQIRDQTSLGPLNSFRTSLKKNRKWFLYPGLEPTQSDYGYDGLTPGSYTLEVWRYGAHRGRAQTSSLRTFDFRIEKNAPALLNLGTLNYAALTPREVK